MRRHTTTTLLLGEIEFISQDFATTSSGMPYRSLTLSPLERYKNNRSTSPVPTGPSISMMNGGSPSSILSPSSSSSSSSSLSSSLSSSASSALFRLCYFGLTYIILCGVSHSFRRGTIAVFFVCGFFNAILIAAASTSSASSSSSSSSSSKNRGRKESLQEKAANQHGKFRQFSV